MRVSADEDDPGYGPDAHKVHCISLDDKLLRDVVTADDDLGEVLLYVTDHLGQRVSNATGTGPLKELRKGKVEIVLVRQCH